MLRKTLIALSAAAALGVSSGAMAASHGGHGSSGAMQGHSGGGMQGSTFSKGSAQSFGGTTGSSQVRPTGSSQVRPMGPSGQAWNGGQWGHNRHHHRHDRFFFGAGFAGPYYDDYGYDSCWRIVPTYYGGWRRVWVCGDYPYGGYYGGY